MVGLFVPSPRPACPEGIRGGLSTAIPARTVNQSLGAVGNEY